MIFTALLVSCLCTSVILLLEGKEIERENNAEVRKDSAGERRKGSKP